MNIEHLTHVSIIVVNCHFHPIEVALLKKWLLLTLLTTCVHGVFLLQLKLCLLCLHGKRLLIRVTVITRQKKYNYSPQWRDSDVPIQVIVRSKPRLAKSLSPSSQMQRSPSLIQFCTS